LDEPSKGDELFPAVVGYLAENEIYDPDTNDWSVYRSIPDFTWVTLDCFVTFRDKIYHVENVIVEIDPVGWTFLSFGSVPPQYRDPGRCAIAYTDTGAPGILTRNGGFYNLRTNQWSDRKPVPSPFGEDGPVVNAMFPLNNRPAVIGAAACNSLGECTNDEVLVYTEDDDWVIKGRMIEGRRFHEAVPVPKTWCDVFLSSSKTTTEATTESQGTDSTASISTESTTNDTTEKTTATDTTDSTSSDTTESTTTSDTNEGTDITSPSTEDTSPTPNEDSSTGSSSSTISESSPTSDETSDTSTVDSTSPTSTGDEGTPEPDAGSILHLSHAASALALFASLMRYAFF